MYMPSQEMRNAANTEWLINSRWRDRLHEKAAHKALGISHGSPSIRAGIGWKELAILAAGGIGVVGVAGTAGVVALALWLSSQSRGDVTPQPNTPNVEQTTTERTETITREENLDLIFHDGQGNRIVVPRMSEVVE